MKKRIQRTGAATCALLLALSLLPASALAAEKSQIIHETQTDPLQGMADVRLEGTTISAKSLVVLTLTVRNAKTGAAVSGASVKLENRESKTTDSNGQVSLPDLLSGLSYQITVTASGYEAWSSRYTCPSGVNGAVSLTVRLTPEEVTPLPPIEEPDNPSGGGSDDKDDNGGSGSGSDKDDNGSNGSGGGSSGGSTGGSTGGNTGSDSDSSGGGSTGGNTGSGSGSTGSGGSTNGSTGGSGSSGGGTSGGTSGGHTGSSGGNVGGNTGSSGSGSGSSGFGGTGGGTAGSNADGGSASGESERPSVPPIQTEVPKGESAVTVPGSVIEESASSGAGLEFVFPSQNDKEPECVTLPAFSVHDRELLGGGGLSLSRGENGRYFWTVTVPKEETDRTETGLSHNLISAILDGSMDVAIVFEDDTTKNMYLTAEELAALVVPEVDLLLEYDRTLGVGRFVYAVQTAWHGPASSAVIPAAAFALAQKAGLGISCRIYDGESGLELWYEWLFAPEDLQNAVPADTDLFVRAEPEASDPILSLTRNLWCQYIITNHHGPLPAAATLRVKDLEGFPAGDTMALVWADGDRLETVYTGLTKDAAGWFTWGMEHCSSYALMKEQSAAGSSHDFFTGSSDTLRQWLLVGIFVLLALLLLILLLLLFTKRKKEDEHSVPLPAEKTELLAEAEAAVGAELAAEAGNMIQEDTENHG